jgi:protein-export membrane protein SecD
MKKIALGGYRLLMAACLFIVFFVWNVFDESTGKSAWEVSPQGRTQFKKGMDIAGGVRLSYKIDLSKYKEVYVNPQEFAQVTKWVKEIILQNIDGRISKLGVSDYTSYIQSLSDGEYVVVEIGGISNLDEAKEIIGKTVELEFKLPYVGDGSEQRDARQLLAEDLLKQAVQTPALFAGLANSKVADNVFYNHYTGATAATLPLLHQKDIERFATLPTGTVTTTLLEGVYGTGLTLVDGQPQEALLDGWVISKFNWTRTVESIDASGNKNTVTTYDIEDILVTYKPLWVTAQDPKTKKILNGGNFKYANVSQSPTGQPVAVINFDDLGKEIFCNITTAIVGKQLAIFVGGQLVTAPVIREQICGGSAQIDGQFDMVSVKALVENLNEWALPAPLILSHEEKVSPTLGATAAQWALYAWVIGFIAIAMIMMYMYGWRRGALALWTLVSYLLVQFAIIKLVGYALSLSGIAAILLSIGMGVDANVLIFERIKEERAAHKSRYNAIVDGYQRSKPAIIDGNMTTFMIAILLFFMGTNAFKGFGTMMMVNNLLTLFVIMPLTQKFLLYVYGQKDA